ncbi:hypothetical protein CXG81DRAFT_14564, partial [Caulochytrium protostelioides]
GWRAYQSYIGAPIFYAEYTQEIKKALYHAPELQSLIQSRAFERYQTYMQGTAAIAGLSTSKGEGGQPPARRLMPRFLTGCQKHKSIQHFEAEVRKEARSVVNNLIAELDSIRTLRFVGFIVNNLLVRMYHQGIYIQQREVVQLKRWAEIAQREKISLVFLPCHKSHVDYLVISYVFYRLGLALPHIAAGDNLNMPIVGYLLKHAGAFFIKRQWGDDPLYHTTMALYIRTLLQRGHNVEAFIEGTRSRMGKLLQPKFGLIKLIVDAILNGHVNDCVIVPMSIGYDKVIETGTYVNELLGSPKEKETLYGMLSNVNILGLGWGRIDVHFAEPYRLSSFISRQTKVRGGSHANNLFNPTSRATDRNLLCQSLGFKVMADVNRVSVIMPTSLVGTILLTLRGRGVGHNELVRKVNWLVKRIQRKGGHVADFGGMTTDAVVERAVHVLGDLIGRRTDLLEYVYYPLKRFELSFYRNNVIHLFIAEAVVSTAMYATVKNGGPVHNQRLLVKPQLLNDVSFISQLLKLEFIFGPGGLKKNLEETMHELNAAGVIEFDVDRSNRIWVTLSSEERRIGRETFDFYCFLLWPFIETYWLATVVLFSIAPYSSSASASASASSSPTRDRDRDPEDPWIDERVLLNKAQFLGRTLYYEGDLSYFESINKETIKNAFLRLREMGVLLFQRSTGAQTTWIRLAPEWYPPEPLAIPWYLRRPHGRLWDLCENMGRFRREGKNRRDTATVSIRVLRLARMTQLLGDRIGKGGGVGKRDLERVRGQEVQERRLSKL